MSSIEHALQTLRLNPRFARNVVAWRQLPARPPRFAAFPERLAGQLTAALAGHGIRQLYTHQAAAVAAALEGAHVAVVTPAASGKTLCYNLPVLDRLLADPAARALYLFPTKALAQDQLAGLRELVAGLGDEGASRQVDKETRKQGNKETRKQGNKETRACPEPRPELIKELVEGIERDRALRQNASMKEGESKNPSPPLPPSLANY